MYRFKPLEFNRHLIKGVTHPEGRIHSSIYSDGKNLYIFDGVDPVSVHYRILNNFEFSVEFKTNFLDTWAYNLTTKKWKLLMSKDKVNLSNRLTDQVIGVMYEKNYLIICTVVDIIYRRPGIWKSYLYIYDLDKKSIVVQNTSGQAVEFSGASNMIRHKKCLYTIKLSGFEENSFDVYQLNTETLEWKTVYKCEEDNVPLMNICKHTLVYDGKSIFVFGGEITLSNGSTFIPLTRIPMFDLEHFTWKMLDTYGDESHTSHYPVKRINYRTAQYKDPATSEINVIITGGMKFRVGEIESTSDEFCNDVWKLNLTSLKWKCLGSTPSGISYNYSTTVTSDGQLFTFGGIIKNSNNKDICSSSVYSTWLSVPKLEDISWQAVLQYYPNLASKTKEEIVSLGIPWEIFHSRID